MIIGSRFYGWRPDISKCHNFANFPLPSTTSRANKLLGLVLIVILLVFQVLIVACSPPETTTFIEEIVALAEQGNANSQYTLGSMYLQGIGVPKDNNKAFEWFHRAAEQDHVISQHNVAFAYAEGIGVEKDFRQSVSWYRKAVLSQIIEL